MRIPGIPPGTARIEKPAEPAVQASDQFRLAIEREGRGRTVEAVELYRNALELAPGYAEAHNNLGEALLVLGRSGEAVFHLRRACELMPRSGKIWHNLVRLEGLEAGDPRVVKIETLLADPQTTDSDRLHLSFALARVYDNQGRYGEAFDLWREGNHRKRRMLTFDLGAVTAFFAEIEATFGREFFARRQGWGHPAEEPVFIFGMPRSGSSLVEQILASHPQVRGAGESPVLEEIIEDLPRRLSRQVGAGYAACISAMTPKDFREVGREYVACLRTANGRADRICDKALFNFAHLGLIALILPRARLIHCRRHPLATGLSCYSTLFASDLVPFSYDLEELGGYFRLYDRLMAHWRVFLPVPFFEVNYEDLVADQEGITRRLLHFCGLPWDDRCLAFDRLERPVRTASLLQVRKPLYRGSLDHFRHYVDDLSPLARVLDAGDALSSLPLTQLVDPDALYARGLEQAEAGCFEAAIADLLQAVRARPSAAAFHYTLGKAYLAAGRSKEAIVSLRSALARAPRFLEAALELGNAYLATGDLAAAANTLIRLLSRYPESVPAEVNLGFVRERQGRLDEAIAAYRRALARAPSLPEAHFNLGNALRLAGQPEAAAAAFDRALELRPGWALAHNGRGAALLELDRPEEAAAELAKAVRLAPGLAEAHNNQGNALAKLRRLDEAVESLRRALAEKPGFVMAWLNLGNVHQCAGDLEAARQAYDEALRLEPENAEALYLRGLAEPWMPEDPAVASMERLLARSTDLEQTANLGFTLGKVYDEHGDPARAWARFECANRARRREVGGELAADLARIDQILRTFDRAAGYPWASSGIESRLPVFLVGLPRTGKTIVESRLVLAGAHAGGELPTLPRLVAGLATRYSGYPQAVPLLESEQLRVMADAYLDEVQRLAPVAGRVTDTLPGNFLHVGILHQLFPQAAVIHCVRHPLDTCLATYFTNFAQGHGYSFDLDDLARYYRAYRRLMEHWDSLLPGKVLAVRYEALVATPESAMRQVAAHCSLDAPCERVSSALPSLHAREVGRWRHYRAFLARLEESLADWIEAYELAPQTAQ